MIVDEIKQRAARGLADKRAKAITGIQLRALFEVLPDSAYNTMASYFAANNGQALGEWQIKGLKNRLEAQALSDINGTINGNLLDLVQLATLVD